MLMDDPTGLSSQAGDYLALLLEKTLLFLPKLITALVIFVVALYMAGWVARLIRTTAARRDADPELTELLSRLGQWSVIILGTLWALETVDRNITGFVAGLGIVGFTVGFAMQDVAKNFIAGILLLWQQPFDVGDTIEVKGYTGKVMDVNIRATELRTFDGLHVLIPNADVYINPITNYTRPQERRITLEVGVSYDSDLTEVSRVALEAIASLPGLKEDPAPVVVFNRFGDSAVIFTLSYWVDLAQTGYGQALDAGVKLIHGAFARAGIEIPYPVRTLIQK
ncbi:MAG: mechanosensitive ion channel family protein [Caldilineae bacterium]|nr:MAG: mechanosensitive ion channel family protein [Caldilineae bacterium]